MLQHILPASALSIIIASQAACAAEFTLTSSELHGDLFPPAQQMSAAYGFGCNGDNRSPSFSWSGAPAGTKSFALRIYDRDAPTGTGWIHWQVINIPATAHHLSAAIAKDNHGLPAGALQTRTDFGEPGYGGPCPPAGQTHRYRVTLTALKVAALPGVSADSMPALVGFMTKANALGEASLQVSQSR